MIFQVAHCNFQVTFSKKHQSIATLEGLVSCALGDAIVTGAKGESWPVPREVFFRKYTPIPGVVAGEGGQYIKRLAFVQARQLDREETIELSEGRGTLTNDLHMALVSEATLHWSGSDPMYHSHY